MSYDQGQYSIGPWNWIEESNDPTLPRNETAMYRKMATNVEFDAASQLQIEFSSTTHVPQSGLAPTGALTLTLDDRFISYDMFLFKSPLDDEINAMGVVGDFLFPMWNDMSQSLANANLLLWSRNRITTEIIRASQQYESFTIIQYNIPQAASFRDQIWALCAETLRNYDPQAYKRFDNILIRPQGQSKKINQSQIRNEVLKSIASYKNNFYNQYIAQYEGRLNAGTLGLNIQELGQKLLQFVRNPNNHLEIISNTLNTLILWLTAPHVESVGLSTPELDYCMFVLAVAVIYKRIPTDEEWMQRVTQGSIQNGSISGAFGPTIGPTINMLQAGLVSVSVVVAHTKALMYVFNNIGLSHISAILQPIVRSAETYTNVAQVIIDLIIENAQWLYPLKSALEEYISGVDNGFIQLLYSAAQRFGIVGTQQPQQSQQQQQGPYPQSHQSPGNASIVVVDPEQQYGHI